MENHKFYLIATALISQYPNLNGNEYKIRNGMGKWILREAMRGVLPEKVRCRKDKVGHNVPADEWFRNENRHEIEDLIEKKSFINTVIYNQKSIRNLFQEHLNGANHYMFFWQYINLNIWYEMNFLNKKHPSQQQI